MATVIQPFLFLQLIFSSLSVWYLYEKVLGARKVMSSTLAATVAAAAAPGICFARNRRGANVIMKTKSASATCGKSSVGIITLKLLTGGRSWY